jgi:hypothetical protein
MTTSALFKGQSFIEQRLGKKGTKTRLFKKSYKEKANKSETLIKVESTPPPMEDYYLGHVDEP